MFMGGRCGNIVCEGSGGRYVSLRNLSNRGSVSVLMRTVNEMGCNPHLLSEGNMSRVEVGCRILSR